MYKQIRSIGLVIVALATGGMLLIAMPGTASAQDGSCSVCIDSRICDTQAGKGAGACRGSPDGCKEEMSLCTCLNPEMCIILFPPDPPGGDQITMKLTPDQIAPEYHQDLPASIESYEFVRSSNGMLALWSCTGELLYALEKRNDGLLIPVDVHKWRGRLGTREVSEGGRVLIRVI